MDALVKTREVGGSLMVTLPKDVVREKEILPNELIEIDVEKIKRDYFGALKGISAFAKEDELEAHD